MIPFSNGIIIPFVDIVVLILQVQTYIYKHTQNKNKNTRKPRKLNKLHRIALLIIRARIGTHVLETLWSKLQVTVLHYLNVMSNNWLPEIFTWRYFYKMKIMMLLSL